MITKKIYCTLLSLILSALVLTVYSQAPVISSFSPVTAQPGQTLTISGSGFHTTAAKNIVYFGGVKATASAVTGTTTLTVTVPVSASHDFITVLNTGNKLQGSSSKRFLPAFTPNKQGITSDDFSEKTDFSAEFALSVAMGDLDGDGKPDMVTGSLTGNGVSVRRNISSTPETISFAAGQVLTSGDGSVYSVAIGDMDGDGRLDLAVLNLDNNTVSVLLNTSTGMGNISYGAMQSFTTGASPVAAAIADMDGDGRPDIITTNSADNNVSVFRNTGTVSGTISFGARQSFATGGSPTPMAIADMNGDGKLDIITANAASDNTSILLNTTTGAGNISFAGKQDFPAGDTPIGVGVADMDHDGIPDLVVSNSGSNNLSVFRNTGTVNNVVSFASAALFPAGGSPGNLAINDMDGNGGPDIVVRSSNGTVSVLTNASTGAGNISFAAKQDFATGSNPFSVVISDMDGDGKPDIATTNISDNTVSIFRNQLVTAPLPVTLAAFDAEKGENSGAPAVVLLSWQTTSEVNSDHFDVERSTNGKNWETIGNVAAMNSGLALQSYSFRDTAPRSGENLYRLKMVDLDATYAYSRLRSVTFEIPDEVVLYPNPAKGPVKVRVSPRYKGTQATLIKGSGKVLRTFEVPAENFPLNMQQTGIYLLRMYDGRVVKMSYKP